MINDGRPKPRFKPRHPEKYIGDVDNIVIRSSWERYSFDFCDNNPNIIAWASEEIVIPYMKPIFVQGNLILKPAKYYPDLYIEYVDANNKLHREVLEIKPEKQSRTSRARSHSTKTIENYVYQVNSAKWTAANEWCKQRGLKFSVLTEKTLFKGKTNK